MCLRELRQGLWINLGGGMGRGWEEVQEEGDICVPTADSGLPLSLSW